ncbi:MAG: NADH-quinone oxidoreductase subunit A [Candidatus Marinimicrobia bacterium]|jgi:NADH-quinone oxidoreductase subunit A|nr:NADH-quinone oxidoreductase subunit A [Candidatus Neomarinimicrobiota bacterium]MBT3682655.1 NADH-quinone oxidoreductase subunit A [Candidatus Neomarinimicrobiota bacterium]MBT3759690.1 NADH-quinone oxidoreductase subunit A [Candidatus Neomarinimicrobiota bacterium]MBT3894439.1 NADH-quinone oxidoreductase subunit A [Candidatus Neomarinimicrobiota bacterium]MBT4172481.1 NADH-quinone oxidoreductase subunit A [Candidatus Neomarinimicrobiota bacterium]
MYFNFAPILIFIIIGLILAGLPFLLQSILSPKFNKGGEKLMTYECGEVPEGSAWVKFNIRFYIIALVFIIFDVEVIFLFPWAVVFQDLGLLAFIEMMIFIFILVVGFAYVWIKGDLNWVKMNVKYGKGRYSQLAVEDTADPS